MDLAGAGRSALRRIAALATANWLLLAAPAALAAGPGKPSPAAKPGSVAVELVGEAASIAAGKPFWVGLAMRHDAHWHSYWINPGDAGMPTTLDWKLPPGFKAGGIEWPFPERLQRGPLASYGYEGEVLLPVLIFPPRTLTGQTTLEVDARWLECSDNCIPREARLALTLPASPAGARATAKAGAAAAAFARARERLPQAAAGLTAAARIRGETLEVSLALPPQVGRRGELFLEPEDIVEPGVVPTLAERDGRLLWSSKLTPNARRARDVAWPAVWVAAGSDGKRRGWRVEVRLP